MSKCKLSCDFGYKKKSNCNICSCNCVNEENYFEEMKNAFTLLNTKSKGNATKFCRKPCKLGYTKDELNCYKCECVEDFILKLSESKKELTTTTTISTTLTTTISTETNDDENCSV